MKYLQLPPYITCPTEQEIALMIDLHNECIGLYNKQDFSACRDKINIAFDIAFRILLYDLMLNVDSHIIRMIFQKTGDIYGELENKEESLYAYQWFQFMFMQMKHDFGQTNNLKVYKFRPFSDFALDDIINNKITLVNPRCLNDIVDCPVFEWLKTSCGKTAKFKKHIPLYRESFNGYRICSFAVDSTERKTVENPLMWAHYASSHTGFCIEYELNSDDFRTDSKSNRSASRIFKVNYENPNTFKLNLNDDHITLSAREAFLTKTSDWSYENEVRILSYNPIDNSDFVPYNLKTSNPIKAIYFGNRCKESSRNIIMKLLSNSDIKFYNMEFNPVNVLKLTAVPLFKS